MDFVRNSKDALAGTSAGVVGTILGFPFDTTKTTMQLSNMSVTNSIRTIYSKSGFVGFYKGVGSPLVALTILNTVNFSSYARFRNLLSVQSPLDLRNKYFEWKIALAAALVGPIASSISTPFELVKTQMQLSASNGPATMTITKGTVWKNSLHAAVDLVKRFGIRHLYLGHSVNTLREMVFLSTYFTVYEHLKYNLSGSNSERSFISLSPLFSVPLSGGCAGACGWFVSFPLDLIKTNIQKGFDHSNILQRKRCTCSNVSIQSYRYLLYVHTYINTDIVIYRHMHLQACMYKYRLNIVSFGSTNILNVRTFFHTYTHIHTVLRR